MSPELKAFGRAAALASFTVFAAPQALAQVPEPSTTPEEQAVKIHNKLLQYVAAMAARHHVESPQVPELMEIITQSLIESAVAGIDNPEIIVHTALNEALSSLDPHSAFLDPETHQIMMKQSRGSFDGIGAQVSHDYEITPEMREKLTRTNSQPTLSRGVKVVKSMGDAGPAVDAGILAEDIITHVDGEPMAGKTVREAVTLITGPRGTKVSLTIERPGEAQPLQFTLIRAPIVTNPVRSAMLPYNVGYVSAKAFTGQTDLNMDPAIEELEAQDAQFYVLDLRRNPGGQVDEADKMIENFIDGELTVDDLSGPIDWSNLSDQDRAKFERNITVSIRRNDGKQPKIFATKGNLIGDKPMVVLIDGGSASASEMVAGALQGHGRAVIIGTQSFGKGSGQAIRPIDIDNDGTPEGAAKITTFVYYAGPGEGRSIQEFGITPDIRVEFDYMSGNEDRRTEASLGASIAAPDDANVITESRAVCRESEARIDFDTIDPNLVLTLPNGERVLDGPLICAIEHLTGQEIYTVTVDVDNSTIKTPDLTTPQP